MLPVRLGLTAISRKAVEADVPFKRSITSASDIQWEFDQMQKPAGSGPKTDSEGSNRQRLDAEAFRGLRKEMNSDNHSVRNHRLYALGQTIVTVAILANAVQLGASAQFDGQPKLLWLVCEHLFTFIFLVELVLKVYSLRLIYFHDAWNAADFVITLMSVASLWLMPLFRLESGLESIQVLRLLRLTRLTRLLRVTLSMRLLVESLFHSLQSLGWILCLLGVISYIFAIICLNLIDKTAYGNQDFDADMYFGDLSKTMLTLLNICLLAEWGEIIRPVFHEQPHLIFFLFVPYLMLCTFGVLNLIIGVIAEQTLAASASHKESEAQSALREKMKAILRMTDEMYESDNDGKLTRQEFIDCSLRHPDFVDTMRQCDFPRGFEVQHLHMIFDDAGEGLVEKDEFINGMFRLVFNNLPQHAATLLLNIAQMKQELHDNVGTRLRKIESLVEDKVEEVHSRLDQAFSNDGLFREMPQKPVSLFSEKAGTELAEAPTVTSGETRTAMLEQRLNKLGQADARQVPKALGMNAEQMADIRLQLLRSQEALRGEVAVAVEALQRPKPALQGPAPELDRDPGATKAADLVGDPLSRGDIRSLDAPLAAPEVPQKQFAPASPWQREPVPSTEEAPPPPKLWNGRNETQQLSQAKAKQISNIGMFSTGHGQVV